MQSHCWTDWYSLLKSRYNTTGTIFYGSTEQVTCFGPDSAGMRRLQSQNIWLKSTVLSLQQTQSTTTVSSSFPEETLVPSFFLAASFSFIRLTLEKMKRIRRVHPWDLFLLLVSFSFRVSLSRVLFSLCILWFLCLCSFTLFFACCHKSFLLHSSFIFLCWFGWRATYTWDDLSCVLSLLLLFPQTRGLVISVLVSFLFPYPSFLVSYMLSRPLVWLMSFCTRRMLLSWYPVCLEFLLCSAYTQVSPSFCSFPWLRTESSCFDEHSCEGNILLTCDSRFQAETLIHDTNILFFPLFLFLFASFFLFWKWLLLLASPSLLSSLPFTMSTTKTHSSSYESHLVDDCDDTRRMVMLLVSFLTSYLSPLSVSWFCFCSTQHIHSILVYFSISASPFLFLSLLDNNNFWWNSSLSSLGMLLHILSVMLSPGKCLSLPYFFAPFQWLPPLIYDSLFPWFLSGCLFLT